MGHSQSKVSLALEYIPALDRCVQKRPHALQTGSCGHVRIDSNAGMPDVWEPDARCSHELSRRVGDRSCHDRKSVPYAGNTACETLRTRQLLSAAVGENTTCHHSISFGTRSVNLPTSGFGEAHENAAASSGFHSDRNQGQNNWRSDAIKCRQKALNWTQASNERSS